MITSPTRAPGRTSARRRRTTIVVGAAIALVLVASGCVVNGTWTALTLASPAPSGLGIVSCVSDTWCLALGSGAQVWDGTTWSNRTAPVTAFPGGIDSVDCFAVDRCAAVETRYDEWLDESNHLLLYDGSTWAEASGVGDLGYGDPNLLSCAVDGCVVADTWDRMITWDGSSVTVEQQHDPIYALNMDCASVDDCLAISGDTFHWDGTSWTEVAEGAPDANELTTIVDCAATTERCVSVGFRSNVEHVAVAMVWDGAAWTEAPLPGGLNTWFTGLSCTTSFECVATGSAFTWGPTSGTRTVLAFIGDAWYATPTPPGGAGAVYQDASCVAQTCIAVGTGTPPGGGADAGIASRYHWTYP